MKQVKVCVCVCVCVSVCVCVCRGVVPDCCVVVVKFDSHWILYPLNFAWLNSCSFLQISKHFVCENSDTNGYIWYNGQQRQI